jgi:hypothetical protein
LSNLEGKTIEPMVLELLGTDPVEVKSYLSNALTTCLCEEFVGVSGLRWPVETARRWKRAKGKR